MISQIRLQTESVNANEIANGVLSALVAITAGCPFVDFWGASLIGSMMTIHNYYYSAKRERAHNFPVVTVTVDTLLVSSVVLPLMA